MEGIWGRRAWQLLWPYVVWSAYYYLRAGGKHDLIHLPQAIVLGSAAYHLWYVPMIVQFVLLAPAFAALFRRIERMRRSAVGWNILFAVSLGVLVYLQVCPVTELPGFLRRHQPALFPSWMLYFTAGALVGCHLEQAGRLVRRIWPACLAVSLVGLVLIVRADWRANAAAGAVAFNVVGLQQPGYALLTLCNFVTLGRLAVALGDVNALARIGTFCGRHSYRAYLAHVECINRLNALLVVRISCLPAYYALLFCW